MIPAEYNPHDGVIEEQMACARFDAAVAELVESVKAYPYMWRWGDGCGGAVYDDISAAFKAAGFQVEQPQFSRPGKRRNLSANVRAQVYARHGLACALCGAKENLTIDHVIPLAKGGSNALDNLQPLCRGCNTKKGAR